MDTQKTNEPLLDTSLPDLWFISPDDVPQVWDELLDLFNRNPYEGALAHWEPEVLLETLCEGEYTFLWLGYHNNVIEACMIVRFDHTPQDTILHIMSGNGQLEKYRPYLWKVEKWAFDCGAALTSIYGSKALARVMKKSGYEITEYVITKSIRKQWSN